MLIILKIFKFATSLTQFLLKRNYNPYYEFQDRELKDAKVSQALL